MPRTLVVTRTVLTAVVALAAACGESDATAPTSSSSLLAADLSTGVWTVASLTQGTEDKSSQFDGITLAFSGKENGILTATRNGQSVSGTWSHSPAVTYYGSTSKESLVMNLGTAAPFDRISKTWNVTASTSNRVSFEQPELAEQSHLTLVRP